MPTPPAPPLRIAAILTCHNRREKTLACLRALRAQVLPGWNPGEESEKWNAKSGKKECTSANAHDIFPSGVDSLSPERVAPPGLTTGQSSSVGTRTASPALPVSAFLFPLSTFSIEVFLVDDGCTDGTAEAVRVVWPEVTIIRGDGNLFWCGGMRVAWERAARENPDFYLLVNDDTVLEENAVSVLLTLTGSPDSRRIGVAAIRDPGTGLLVYGGVRGRRFTRIPPDGTPAPCDTMNTNCALVPRAVFRELGMFHQGYTHAMGDFDYGFQATKRGISLWQSGIFLGICPDNPSSGTWRDRSLPLQKRWRLLLGPKGLPPLEWWTFTSRNLGPLWLLRFVSPYLRVILGR